MAGAESVQPVHALYGQSESSEPLVRLRGFPASASALQAYCVRPTAVGPPDQGRTAPARSRTSAASDLRPALERVQRRPGQREGPFSDLARRLVRWLPNDASQ